MKTSQATITAALAFAGGVSAFWRMPCRFQTGIGRMDPIVDKGRISAHVHSITGSSGFSMDCGYDDLTADGTCTACSVKQDHSAYWTPPLYFMYSNGTTVMVPQVGGMLAYYLYYLDQVQAFPEGFMMIAGNPNVRNFTGPFPDTPLSSWDTDATNDQFFLQQRALGFNCLNYAIAAEPSLYRHTLPSKQYLDAHCPDGIRLELAFPSCGKKGELDSEDHRSHVAYPSLVKEGNCPDGYDVHYPFLFYETIFATDTFNGEDGEFVLSFGDPTGTGYHGDFMMGWESQGFLQNALDTCKNPSGEISDCPLFDIDEDSASQCTFDMPPELKHDKATGPRHGLPVDIPIQYGPEMATTYKVAGQHGAPTTGVEMTHTPKTFSHPAVTYSPADPESTKSAQGGIVVAEYTSGAHHHHHHHPQEVPDNTIAPVSASAPAPTSADAAAGEFIATSYITSGNTVYEVFITETDVTVTATAPEAAPTGGAGSAQHLQHHQHHGHGHGHGHGHH